MIGDLQPQCDASAFERNAKVGSEPHIERQHGLGLQRVGREEKLTAIARDDDRVRRRRARSTLEKGQRRSDRLFQAVGDTAHAEKPVRADQSRGFVLEEPNRCPEIVEPRIDANRGGLAADVARRCVNDVVTSVKET